LEGDFLVKQISIEPQPFLSRLLRIFLLPENHEEKSHGSGETGTRTYCDICLTTKLRMMKGHALLVGVNTFDTTHYTGNRYFADAFDDIPVISGILNDVGIFHPDNTHVLIDLEHKPDNGAPQFKSETLTSNPVLKPTAANFLRIIDEHYIQQDLSEGGFLVIFFSGHGASVEVTVTKDNEDKQEKRQFLCFQDRMLVENEMRERLTKIPKNFKVFFVVNACYSGGLSQEKFNQINWQNTLGAQLTELNALFDTEDEALPFELQDPHALLSPNKSLLVNRYMLDLIARGEAVRNTLEKHNNYMDKIQLFSDSYMDYATEFCYLFSCDKDQITQIGWLDEPSYFPKLLKKTWDDTKSNTLTYREFEEKLKAGALPYIQPRLDLFPDGGTTIFETAYPFHYQKKPAMGSILSVFKTQTMATLELKPFPHANPSYVEIDIVGGGYFFINLGLSTTYKLGVDNSNRLKDILALLKDSELADIQYLGVIDVTEVMSPSGQFPLKMPKMEIVDWPADDDTEDGDGLIVLYDSENKALKGKKRTNGKVSNTQG
jgi:hypothetical protein